MIAPKHPAWIEGCPGCGDEDMSEEEKERGRCDDCSAAAVFAKARQCGWNLAQVRYMHEREAESDG